MKTNSLQIARQIVDKNRDEIQGNIAEYLCKYIDEDENNFYHFLTDEEMEQMNGKPDVWNQLGEEVYSFFKNNYNYDIY